MAYANKKDSHSHGAVAAAAIGANKCIEMRLRTLHEHHHVDTTHSTAGHAMRMRALDSTPEPLGLASRRHSIAQSVARSLWRWLLTLSVVASLATVLLHYSHVVVMDKRSKSQFNAVITGLSIALGLSLTASFDDMIKDLRWCVLSRRPRSRRKVERILRADSLVNLLHLAFTSRRCTIHVAVAMWMLLVLGTQVAVASLGLCYSVDAATGETLSMPGDLLVADMSKIQTYKLVPSYQADLAAMQYTAHSYGIISDAFLLAALNTTPTPGTIYTAGMPLIFCGGTEAHYFFRETSAASVAADGTNTLSIITNRSMSASTACQAWRVTAGGNGNETQITVAAGPGPDGDGDLVIDLPMPAGGTNQTTYMVNTTETCGPGCASVTAFEASPTDPWYYACNITVSGVANATRPEHETSLELRQAAAGAIALQGVSASSLVADSSLQYQAFPAEGSFGVPRAGNVDLVSLTLSQFAIGVVTTAAEFNSHRTITGGDAPARGEMVTIKHPGWIIAILVGAVCGQLLLETGVAIWAYRVSVPPDHTFAHAQVIRQMTLPTTTSGWAGALSTRGEAGGLPWKSASGLSRAASKSGFDPPFRHLPGPGRVWIYRATPMAEPGMLDMHMAGLDVQQRMPTGSSSSTWAS